MGESGNRRKVASFSPQIPCRFNYILEGIILLFFGTIRDPRQGSIYHSQRAVRLIKEIRTSVDFASVGGSPKMNAAWQLLQGPHYYVRGLICGNPHCGRMKPEDESPRIGRADWHPDIAGVPLCEACYQYAMYGAHMRVHWMMNTCPFIYHLGNVLRFQHSFLISPVDHAGSLQELVPSFFDKDQMTRVDLSRCNWPIR